MTGSKGQQAIDTIRDFHFAALEAFGVFYVAVLALSTLWCLLWLAKERREWKARAARRKAAAARARGRGRRGGIKAA